MGSTKRPILIVGATGSQGGALIRALLNAGATDTHELLAVTRNPSSGSAKSLQERGVKIVQGDLNDVPGIFSAAKKLLGKDAPDIWGVYSVQNPMTSSIDAEITQGKAMVDGALANGVKFFVYSSVDRGVEEKSYETKTKIPHFISKHDVEHHLVEKSKGKMGWIILRFCTFMDMLVHGFLGKIMATSWKMVVEDRPLQLISSTSTDIGWFGAQAFLNPTEYSGRGISLAGNALKFKEATAIFKKRVGSDIPTMLEIIDRGILWASEELGTMFQCFNDEGCGADIEVLRRRHPKLKRFEDWLETESQWVERKEQIEHQSSLKS